MTRGMVESRCSIRCARSSAFRSSMALAGSGLATLPPAGQGRRPDPTRTASCRGSPGTPTASSAGITHFAEIKSPADFRKRCPHRRLRSPRALHRSRSGRGDTEGPLRCEGTDVLMFALTSGTTNRPKTIPGDARVAQGLSRRLDNLGDPWPSKPTPGSSIAA